MKTSLFEKLRQPTTVVLSAGHGAGDPGTVNGDFKEADEAIIIVDAIAKQLKKRASPSTSCLMKTASKQRSNMSMLATMEAAHGRSKSIVAPRMVCR
jgi:N-acetylmuramoyl-L-alanine amidase